MFYILGIDPGKKGAIGILTSTGKPLGVHDCPLDDEDKYPDPMKMANLVCDIMLELEPQYPIFGALEKAIQIPGQGIGAGAEFMYYGGVWEGILAASGVNYRVFHPSHWKRQMLGVTGGDKQISLSVARELMPSAAVWLERKKDDGRAEALLIAEYARRLIASGVWI